jgi:F5/8 type C domain
VLFDNIVESGSGSLKLINRGDWGTSHGWGSAHSVAWNFNKGMFVQKPPTAQNYGISQGGSFPTNFAWPGPQGFTEQQAGTLVPASLYEAQLCDRLRPAGQPVEVTPGAGAVTASTVDGSNVPGNAVDNDLGTRWSGLGDGAWIRFDLGSTRTVTSVRIAVFNGTSRRNRFDLQVSGDGIGWTTVLPGAESSGGTLAEESYDVSPPRPARFVRYLGHGSDVSAWNSLTEVSIFAQP